MMEASEKRKKLVLWTCMFGNLLSSAVYSLQAPFLPAEAEKKGVTPTEYGILFGIYELVILFASPIVGSKLATLGPKFCFCSGLILLASCCSMFGFLNWSPGSFKFLALAYSLRIVEGFGQCIYVISALGIISATFPETANEKLALMSSIFMVGMIVSPSIGGVLYSLGGFGLPFHVVGGLIYIGAIGSVIVMPNFDAPRKPSNLNAAAVLWSSPYTWLTILPLVTVAVCFGFLQSTLEPHIRPFNYSTAYVGLFFIVTPCIQVISLRVIAYFLDNGFQPTKIIILGEILLILAFSLIGPFPWISLEPNPYLVIAGLVINGVAISCITPSGFAELLKVAKILELQQNEATTGVVSSIWQASFSVGIFSGPLIGGLSLQYVDFRLGTLFPIISNICVIILLSLFGSWKKET